MKFVFALLRTLPLSKVWTKPKLRFVASEQTLLKTLFLIEFLPICLCRYRQGTDKNQWDKGFFRLCRYRQGNERKKLY